MRNACLSMGLAAGLLCLATASAAAQGRGGAGMGGGMMGGGMAGGMRGGMAGGGMMMGRPPMMQGGMAGGSMQGGMMQGGGQCQMGQSGATGGAMASSQGIGGASGMPSQTNMNSLRQQLQNANANGTTQTGAAASRRSNVNPAAMIRNLDKNGDGELSDEEIPRRLRSKLLAADTDGDGAITLAELEAARTAR